MKIANNILETIGNTPMVILNNITKDLPCKVWAKYETFNPGNSANFSSFCSSSIPPFSSINAFVCTSDNFCCSVIPSLS